MGSNNEILGYAMDVKQVAGAVLGRLRRAGRRSPEQEHRHRVEARTVAEHAHDNDLNNHPEGWVAGS
jgi:hypothetical protein